MSFTIAVDFDGTCVHHRYPDVGADVLHAVRWLQAFVAAGARIILWTMRSDGRDDGTTPLADAVAWFDRNGVPLFGINENPTQAAWTSSRKVLADAYIDDAAVGCPLRREDPRIGGRPYVDWDALGPGLLARIREAFPPPRPQPEDAPCPSTG